MMVTLHGDRGERRADNEGSGTSPRRDLPPCSASLKRLDKAAWARGIVAADSSARTCACSDNMRIRRRPRPQGMLDRSPAKPGKGFTA